jgi:uncharacterized delta-60 repeat protein
VLAITALIGSVRRVNAAIVSLNSGAADTSFVSSGPGVGAFDWVHQLALQSDNKILVAHASTTFNGVSNNRIVRLNVNGSTDNSFNVGTGLNDEARGVVVQSDGKIIVVGRFTSYNGTARNRIVRINSDGTDDNTFNIGTGFDDVATKAAIQSDGKIVVIGGFTSFNGTTRNRVARLNSDGTLDTTFDVGAGPSNSPEAVAIQSDGKILLGGTFTSFNSNTCRGFARLTTTGSFDSSVDIRFSNFGSTGRVSSFALQPDGKILAGGAYNTYNDTTISVPARINADGSIDAAFNTGLGSGGSGAEFLTLQPDGKILAGGNMTAFNGVNLNRIVRINSNGTRDATFNIGTGFDSAPFSIVVQPDGNILIGGTFTSYNSQPYNRIIRLIG